MPIRLHDSLTRTVKELQRPDPADPQDVFSFYNSGPTVYAVGTFTTMGGQTRNRIAAIDAGTGAVTAWDPNADGDIYAVGVSGSVVYVGGNFANTIRSDDYADQSQRRLGSRRSRGAESAINYARRDHRTHC